MNSNRGQSLLFLAYIVGGTVGLVFMLAVALATVQRALMVRRSQAPAGRGGQRERADQLLVVQTTADAGSTGVALTSDTPPSPASRPPPPYQRHFPGVVPARLRGSGDETSSSSTQRLTESADIMPPSYDEVIKEDADKNETVVVSM